MRNGYLMCTRGATDTDKKMHVRIFHRNGSFIRNVWMDDALIICIWKMSNAEIHYQNDHRVIMCEFVFKN